MATAHRTAVATFRRRPTAVATSPRLRTVVPAVAVAAVSRLRMAVPAVAVAAVSRLRMAVPAVAVAAVSLPRMAVPAVAVAAVFHRPTGAATFPRLRTVVPVAPAAVFLLRTVAPVVVMVFPRRTAEPVAPAA
jgi:hypothetical protein